MRDIGFKVNVVIIDTALTYEYSATKPWDAHVFLGGPGADPASIAPFIKSDATNNLGARGWPTFWETFIPDPNGYIYNNPEVDDLLNQGLMETDPEKRKAIYQNIDCIWNEELPAISTVAPADLMAHSKHLQGVDWVNWAGVGQINNAGLYRPADWWIWDGK